MVLELLQPLRRDDPKPWSLEYNRCSKLWIDLAVRSVYSGGHFLRAARFAAAVGLGLLLVAIGLSVSGPALRVLRFWTWCYSNRIPCPLFLLEYHFLGLTLSTGDYSAALILLNLGSDIVALGFALVLLTVGGQLLHHGRAS